jgi:hypothetical protein
MVPHPSECHKKTILPLYVIAKDAWNICENVFFYDLFIPQNYRILKIVILFCSYFTKIFITRLSILMWLNIFWCKLNLISFVLSCRFAFIFASMHSSDIEHSNFQWLQTHSIFTYVTAGMPTSVKYVTHKGRRTPIGT